MKVFSFAILAAVAASASASAPASLLLRGSDEKRDLKVNDIRLLKPDPDQLPVGPELPEEALANASDKGKENGRAFGNACGVRYDPCDNDSGCCEGFLCYPNNVCLCADAGAPCNDGPDCCSGSCVLCVYGGKFCSE